MRNRNQKITVRNPVYINLYTYKINLPAAAAVFDSLYRYKYVLIMLSNLSYIEKIDTSQIKP